MSPSEGQLPESELKKVASVVRDHFARHYPKSDMEILSITRADPSEGAAFNGWVVSFKPASWPAHFDPSSFFLRVLLPDFEVVDRKQM